MSPQAKFNNAVCGLLERDIKRWYEIILENQVDLFFLENKKDNKSSDVDPDWLYPNPDSGSAHLWYVWHQKYGNQKDGF